MRKKPAFQKCLFWIISTSLILWLLVGCSVLENVPPLTLPAVTSILPSPPGSIPAPLTDEQTEGLSAMTIEDSEMFLFAANDSSTAEIRNSTIENNIPAADSARVNLYNITYLEYYIGHSVSKNGRIFENGYQVAP